MKLHHVALCVPEIAPAVTWYTDRLSATVTYQDETWALVDVENASIALVLPSQHPPHLSFETHDAEKYGELMPHRIATASVYIQDPFGNTVGFLKPAASETFE